LALLELQNVKNQSTTKSRVAKKHWFLRMKPPKITAIRHSAIHIVQSKGLEKVNASLPGPFVCNNASFSLPSATEGICPTELFPELCLM